MSALQRRLALATCTLMAQGAGASDDAGWAADTSYLRYVEADDRVTVDKVLVDLTRELSNGSVSVNAVHDTMSGASPTGAIRGTEGSVTLTRASGSGDEGYASSTFSDERLQLGFTREQELKRLQRINYGAVISTEDDYNSLGGSVGFALDSKDQSRTYDIGLAFTTDTIQRSDTGDIPVPLGDLSVLASFDEATRETVDGLLGYTRVLNRDTVAQLNLTISYSDGYHSDPYKIISAADENDRIAANFHDSRPQSRLRTSLSGQLKHNLRALGDSLALAWRLYRDDWGITSATGELKYHRKLPRRQYLEPHVRLYQQSAADFFQRSLPVDAASLPVLPQDGLASADYRLDALTSLTLGLKYGIAFSDDLDFRIRAELIDQSADEAEFDSNRATLVQTSLRYRF